MSDRFNLDELLHPAQAFDHPMEVTNDPDLTLNEKRAILASWASDACAIETAQDLRETYPGRYVRFDDVMDVLRELDKEIDGNARTPPYRRPLRKGRLGGLLRRGKPDHGHSLQ